MLNFTHTELSNIVDFKIQTVELSLWLNFDVAVYTALVLATDCNISQLPARPYCSAEYPRWREMTGSDDNVTISCKYCCR